MENKNIKDLEKQNNIVRDGLNYHFRGTTKKWNVPNNMQFMNELLNEINKLKIYLC